MAIALTTDAGLTCRPDTVPVALLELSEAPDAVRKPADLRAGEQTTVHVLDGVLYVLAGDDNARWVELYCAG
jgi:hypothetical protein